MRYFVFLVLGLSLFSVTVSAQSRQQAIDKLSLLRQKAEKLEKDILSPDSSDLKAAVQENAKVFRILPRGKYDGVIYSIRGNGAYYSFSKQSHSYDDTPQIELQQNYLSAGFYGGNYGLIADLGEISLDQIDENNVETKFLIDYQPLTVKSNGQVQRRHYDDRESGSLNFKKSVSAMVGHSYVLRAISFDEADTLVAFKIYRQDNDGSLIIFWKLIKEFEKPMLARR